MSPDASRRKAAAQGQGAESGARAVQVAFDVEEAVIEAVRTAALQAHVSSSTQIRSVLGLPVGAPPKRPRLTVTLDDADYVLLAKRYGLPAGNRLDIKEAATRELIAFAAPTERAPAPAKATDLRPAPDSRRQKT